MFDSTDNTCGNNRIKSYLKLLVTTNRVPNSLLFVGSKSTSKELFAEELASLLVGGAIASHPDVYCYKPEGKIGMHGVEGIRQLKEEAYLPPYKSAKKVFLIYDAERMLPYSANAVLKIFEEPPAYNIIILISSFPEKILPTILSRCHIVRFQGSASCQIKVNPTVLFLLDQRKNLSYPQLLKAVKLLVKEIEDLSNSQGEIPKDLSPFQLQLMEKQNEGASAIRVLTAAEAVFEQVMGWFRDMALLQCNGLPEHLYHIGYEQLLIQAGQRGEFEELEKIQQVVLEAKLALERSAPLQYVLEHLFLSI
ncbi:Uncharacterized protein PHSC3_000343 [Chlamydiales bacterium STE3]|nr:Uncharacterized protein PHSC3_000343 [Chlamydiales bacterium STE3]